MMYYLLFYTTAPNYIEKRQPYRKKHLEMLNEAVERGEVILGGALENPADKAVIVFKCENDQPVRDFVAKDPYVQYGAVASWEIREWRVVIGKNI